MKAEYVDHMGSDLSVVNAARVSFDKVGEALGVNSDGSLILKEGDVKLIHYLSKYNHWTPFAHTSITLRMQAPVPIRTQCFKHKQGFTENEESRRYISGAPEVFVPESFRRASENKKQGSEGAHPDSGSWKDTYLFWVRGCLSTYERMITAGVCPEQARFILPQGVEVNWIWTGNLASYARFYSQRADPHAQKEVQDLARMVGDIIEPLFPVSWRALTRKDTA